MLTVFLVLIVVFFVHLEGFGLGLKCITESCPVTECKNIRIVNDSVDPNDHIPPINNVVASFSEGLAVAGRVRYWINVNPPNCIGLKNTPAQWSGKFFEIWPHSLGFWVNRHLGCKSGSWSFPRVAEVQRNYKILSGRKSRLPEVTLSYPRTLVNVKVIDRSDEGLFALLSVKPRFLDGLLRGSSGSNQFLVTEPRNNGIYDDGDKRNPLHQKRSILVVAFVCCVGCAFFNLDALWSVQNGPNFWRWAIVFFASTIGFACCAYIFLNEISKSAQLRNNLVTKYDQALNEYVHVESSAVTGLLACFFVSRSGIPLLIQPNIELGGLVWPAPQNSINVLPLFFPEDGAPSNLNLDRNYIVSPFVSLYLPFFPVVGDMDARGDFRGSMEIGVMSSCLCFP